MICWGTLEGRCALLLEILDPPFNSGAWSQQFFTLFRDRDLFGGLVFFGAFNPVTRGNKHSNMEESQRYQYVVG